MIDIDILADRHLAALRARWDTPGEVVLGTFADAGTLRRWHPDHTLESHRALVAAMTLRLAAAGSQVLRFVVTDDAYARWRGSRPDTADNRARFIGERGAVKPWRLGIQIDRCDRDKGGMKRKVALGWCVFDLDGPRAGERGVIEIDR